MLFQNALVGTLLVAGQAVQVSAGYHQRSVLDRASGLLRRSEGIDEHLRRHANDIVARLDRRQDASASATASAPVVSTTPQSGDASKINLNAWETQTQTACENALAALNGQASNPSGMAVCYNLPFLDNTTGVFEAELRMYNISAPIAPWTGIASADVSLTLSYLGATVQAMNMTVFKRDSATTLSSSSAVMADGELVARQDGSGSGGSSVAAPSNQLKVLRYVGKINSNLMGSAMTQATLQPLLIPSIILTAPRPGTSSLITTTLSSTEASFVSGVFASASAGSPTSPAAQASASAAVAAATPFVLPGTKLAFFPTGLVVTCVWTGGLALAVGLGTVGRVQFREQYRRRMKREGAVGVVTI
ncbi:hypothetical protein AOQ84DRAFT_131423 [Glonium stellatum]|uniref:Uncharacterized protein n=1 Tax=Glonium stellatum TaxID=574774 RepID=A0A8E2JX61_9PEZI|nr:hypothetical protein AOQ84DRAFT_131423 [Glonium stellatum]